MEEKKIRLVVTVHPLGGIITEMTDIEQTKQSHATGNTYRTPAELGGVLLDLGLPKEYDMLKRLSWPASVEIIVFLVPDTEKLKRTLGFLEIGSR